MAKAAEAVRELEKRLDALSDAVAKPDELPIKRLLADGYIARMWRMKCVLKIL